jgi:cobalt-zinc-cadmium efflux system outer membrane protein
MQKISVRQRASSRARLSDFAVRRTILSFLFGSAAALGQAAQTPSFAALLQQSQANAPLLLEQAANRRAASADASQASAWLNPTLSATAENLGAPQSGGVSQRQDTYAITQVFEIGGKRSARIEAEQRKATATGARERQARLAFTGELAVAYATAEAMQQRKAVADAELARANDDLRAAQALVRAGREAELRLAQARASAAAAQAAVQSTSADATETLERLSALAGSAEPFTRIDHPFMVSVATPRPQTDWIPAQSPALASASAERDAVVAQIKVEEQRWVPDLGVTIGVRKFGWTSEKAATIGLSATIPLFDRNKAGIDAAKERASSAAMRLEATRLESVALHRSALAQVQASERRLEAAEEGEIAATEAYRLGRIGYDAGKTPLLELLAIRRALSEAQALTIDARLSRVRALATLSLAEGRNVFGVAP